MGQHLSQPFNLPARIMRAQIISPCETRRWVPDNFACRHGHPSRTPRRRTKHSLNRLAESLCNWSQLPPNMNFLHRSHVTQRLSLGPGRGTPRAVVGSGTVSSTCHCGVRRARPRSPVRAGLIGANTSIFMLRGLSKAASVAFILVLNK